MKRKMCDLILAVFAALFVLMAVDLIIAAAPKHVEAKKAQSFPTFEVVPLAVEEIIEYEAVSLNSKQGMQEEVEKAEVDDGDWERLACVIYQEAGGDECCDLCRYRVADVVLNRVNDPRFPDSIEEVLEEPKQWGLYSETGIIWPVRAGLESEAGAVARAYDIAYDVLSGNHSDLTSRYIWCAEFPQGDDWVYCDGIYFGRS